MGAPATSAPSAPCSSARRCHRRSRRVLVRVGKVSVLDLSGGTLSPSSERGMSTIAVVPPNGEGRSMTLMPCRAASRPTTKSPSRSLSAGSNSGGCARRSLIAAYSSGVRPSPRSSTSTAKPLPTMSPRTVTVVSGGENMAALSISSAMRWVTSATAGPISVASVPGTTLTRV